MTVWVDFRTICNDLLNSMFILFWKNNKVWEGLEHFQRTVDMILSKVLQLQTLKPPVKVSLQPLIHLLQWRHTQIVIVSSCVFCTINNIIKQLHERPLPLLQVEHHSRQLVGQDQFFNIYQNHDEARKKVQDTVKGMNVLMVMSVSRTQEVQTFINVIILTEVVSEIAHLFHVSYSLYREQGWVAYLMHSLISWKSTFGH